MPRLLVIETSPRGDASVSRRLTRRFVARWRATHPDGDVGLRDLADIALLHVRDRDIAPQYLRLILGVIGITDVTVIAGGGAKAVDLRESTMDDFVARHEAAIEAAASA